MIARIWDGAVPAELGEAYHQFLLRSGVPDYRANRGNLGVYMLRRVDGDTARFRLITLWEDADAIRAFAGQDMERARYYPEDDHFLRDRQHLVDHYEVLFAHDSSTGSDPTGPEGPGGRQPI